MKDVVESRLRQLPEPAVPAPFARTVMARLSRLPEGGRPMLARSAATHERAAAPAHDLPAWVAALAGLAIVLAAWTYGGLRTGSWLDLAFTERSAASLVTTTSEASALLGLALGLLLFVAGLLAPLRDGR